jgi:Shedu protein SduA, C-terminal
MRSLFYEFKEILESSKGERAAHSFLKKNKHLIVMAFNPAWNFYTCIPEFSMGRDFRSDFLILSAHSVHWYAIFIELKRVGDRLYLKNGTPSKALRGAQRQIYEWNEWIRLNEPYLRRSLAEILRSEGAPAMCSIAGKYADKATEISDMSTYLDFDFHVVIGRREALNESEQRARVLDTTFSGPQIATYNRLLDVADRCDKAETEKAQRDSGEGLG